MISKGYIYKLCIKDGSVSDIYIGSTTNPKVRKYDHKKHSKNINGKQYNYYVYQFIREHGTFDNWDMIILEKLENIDKHELRKKERYYIEQLKPTLNQVIPMNYINGDKWNQKEYFSKYYEIKKDKFMKHNHEYYDKNKEKILEHQKEYTQQRVTCPICKEEYNKSSMTRHIKRKHSDSNTEE